MATDPRSGHNAGSPNLLQRGHGILPNLPKVIPQATSPGNGPSAGAVHWDDPPSQVAGFWHRVLSIGLDLLLVSVLANILGAMAVSGELLAQWRPDDEVLATASYRGAALASQLFSTLAVAYLMFFTAYGGRTPGKMLTGLQVQQHSGEPPTGMQVLLRTVGYVVSASLFGLGFLLAAGTAKLGLHDRMSGTRVVRVIAPTETS